MRCPAAIVASKSSWRTCSSGAVGRSSGGADIEPPRLFTDQPVRNSMTHATPAHKRPGDGAMTTTEHRADTRLGKEPAEDSLDPAERMSADELQALQLQRLQS